MSSTSEEVTESTKDSAYSIQFDFSLEGGPYKLDWFVASMTINFLNEACIAPKPRKD